MKKPGPREAGSEKLGKNNPSLLASIPNRKLRRDRPERNVSTALLRGEEPS
jgi:hypothetical protein